MNNKILYSLIAIGFIGLTWFFLGRDSTDTMVITVSPKQGEFEVVVNTTGELRSKNSTKIMGPTGARDVRLFNLTIQTLVPEGTFVRKGDFVAELDRSEITSRLQDAQLQMQRVQAQYEQAQLDSSLTLTQARNNLENLEFQLEERQIAVDQSIYESPAVQRQTQIELDRTRRQLEQDKENYKTRVRQAEARLREIATDLEKERNNLNRIQQLMSEFTVRAPETGMVIYARSWNGRKTTSGSGINAFDPVVAELPDFSVMESVTYVNEVDIQKVKVGQSVVVGLDAISDKRLTGRVMSVANIGEQRPNSDSKVFEVIIQVNESDTTLRPAMTTSNTIMVQKLPETIFVPLETIHTSDSLQFVYKREGLQTVRQQVFIGPMNENDAVILAGVNPDDRLLISAPPTGTSVNTSYLPAEVVEQFRAEEEARLEALREQERERQRDAAPAFDFRNLDLQNMTPAQRDSIRTLMQQRGGQQGGQQGGGTRQMRIQMN